MSDIIFNHLISSLKQPHKENEKKITHDYNEKIADKIKSLFIKAIKANDNALLATLCVSLNRDLCHFFSKTSSPNHADRIAKDIHIALCQKTVTYKDRKGVPWDIRIPFESMMTIRANMPEFKEYKYVYELARHESGINFEKLHDIYTHPDLITPKEQALMLALGFDPSSSSVNLSPDLIDENVKRNSIIRLLHTYNHGRRTIPTSASEQELASGYPAHFMGISALSVLYLEAMRAYRPKVTLTSLVNESFYIGDVWNCTFPDHELHKELLTSSNSLVKTVNNYMQNNSSYMSNYERAEDGRILRVSTKSGSSTSHFLAMLNEDVRLTRLVVQHVDKLCSILSKNAAQALAKCSARNIMAPLHQLFARSKYPYMPEYGSTKQDIVTRCCVDMELKGIARLAADISHQLRPQQKQNYEHLEWIAQKLPIKTLIYMVSEKLLPETDMRAVMLNLERMRSSSFYGHNKAMGITDVARLLGTLESHYPQLIEGSLFLESVTNHIAAVEMSAGLTGLYQAQFTRAYYGEFETLSSAPNADADMAFVKTAVI